MLLLLLLCQASDKVQPGQAFCRAPVVSLPLWPAGECSLFCLLCMVLLGSAQLTSLLSSFSVPFTHTMLQPDWTVYPTVSPLSFLIASGSLLMLFPSPSLLHPAFRLSFALTSHMFVHWSFLVLGLFLILEMSTFIPCWLFVCILYPLY